MTDKQRRFADEYLIDCNATQAAIRAGYSKNHAHTNANRLLQIAAVKEYIDERLAQISSDKIAQAEEIMEYLTAVLRGQSSSEIVVVEGVGGGCSSARRISKAPDEKERLKAAELLGKRYGLFTEKVNLDGGTRVVIIDDLDCDD